MDGQISSEKEHYKQNLESVGLTLSDDPFIYNTYICISSRAINKIAKHSTRGHNDISSLK